MVTRPRFVLLLAIGLTVSSAAASVLQFGPQTRVSKFRTGAPGYERAVRVDAVGNDFVAYWAHEDELRAVTITGIPPHPDQATARKTAEQPPMGLQACNDTACASVTEEDFTTNYAVVIEVVSRTTGKSVRVEHSPFYPQGIASDPGGFAITDGTASRFLRIDNSGRVTTDVQFPSPPLSEIISGGAIVFNGDTYALFYTINFQVLAARTVRLDGRLVTLETRVMATPFVPLTAGWNGSEYLLALGRIVSSGGIPESVPENDLFATRIAPDFTPLDAQPLLLATGGANTPVNIAANGGVFYVLWTQSFHAVFEPNTRETVVQGAAVAASGELLSHDVISRGNVSQAWPEVAQGTSTSFAVWQELQLPTDVSTLRYARIARGTGATVAEGVITDDPAGGVDVVALGDEFLVVWHDRFAHAAIFLADGTWHEVWLPGMFEAHAAANRDHWLVAGRSLSGSQALSVAVARDGNVSPPTIIWTDPQNAFVNGIASDGDRFLVTAHHLYLLDSAGTRIAERSTSGGQTDFAAGVYAVETSAGLDFYDRNANYLRSTPAEPSDVWVGTTLTHIGKFFVVTYLRSETEYGVRLYTPDGTRVANDETPRVAIAPTDEATSTAVVTRAVIENGYPAADALFAGDVTIDTTPRRRSVGH